ncbi:MAG: right-handed parallel beta-helix repeat-containing protein [Planctomycetes bacterium]|nr:right-handed parallel beta-helix repeat-containing protein [Planctomycetota bacterium]
MQLSLARISLLMAIAVLCATGAQAATLNVGSGGYSTIQSAIGAANDGDTIVVAAGTYNEHIDFAGKSVTIRSSNPDNAAVVAATIINGTASGTCVTIANGEGQGAYPAILEGFTITNGAYTLVSPAGGGGIYVAGASPVIRKNVITLNQTAADGGGICVVGASVVEISGNTISGNTAEGWGGGVFVYGEDGTAEVTVVGNRVSANEASWDGGGICLFEAVDAEVKNNVIDENIADEVGGGMFAGYDVDAQIVNNTVAANEARGVDLESGSVVRVGRGGGLACFQSGTGTAVDSCIFWSNTAADDGNEISLEAGAYLAVDYSDVLGGQTGVFVETGGVGTPTLVWGTGNIDTLPLFASATDYHVQSEGGRYDPSTSSWVYDAATSPCIDAGNPVLAYDAELAPNGHVVNQGAYGNTAEASKTPVDEPFLTIGTAQFDTENSLMYFDLLMESPNGLTGRVQAFGARATLSGADAAHFTATSAPVFGADGSEMADLCGSETYAWEPFSMGVTSYADGPATVTFGHNTSNPFESVYLQNIAAGTVVARFYYAWDGAAVSEVFVSIESYAGVDPAPVFDFVGTAPSLFATVLNDGANVIVLAGDPDISVATEDGLGWVYQNTAGTLTKGGHKVALTVTVNDLNGNNSVTITVTKVPGSGDGEVDVQAGTTDLDKLIYGSDRSLEAEGTLTLSVVATGDVAGQAEVQVPFKCRLLGDVDDNGGVEPTDMSALINKLNGLDVSGFHAYAFDIDSNGGAEPGDLSLLINILNKLPVP